MLCYPLYVCCISLSAAPILKCLLAALRYDNNLTWPFSPPNLVIRIDHALRDMTRSTIGIDFKIRTIELDGKRIKLQIVSPCLKYLPPDLLGLHSCAERQA